MRKLAVAIGLAAAVLLAGGIAWNAEALTSSPTTAALPAAAKNYSPIEKTACRRRGLRLGPLPGPRSAPLPVRALLMG
jgi:hypothetical protein